MRIFFIIFCIVSVQPVWAQKVTKANTKVTSQASTSRANTTRRPASVLITAIKPLPEPSDKSLPSIIPIYPGAVKLNFKPKKSRDNRSFLVGVFSVAQPIEKVHAFYLPKTEGNPGLELQKQDSIKMAEGWFKNSVRNGYNFRVLLMSPGWDNQTFSYSDKVTEIKYYMDEAK